MKDIIIENESFLEMDKADASEVQFEMRPPSKLMALEKIRKEMRKIGLQTLLYDRSPVQGSMSVRPGEIKVPIKCITKIGGGIGGTGDKNGWKSTVFFFGFRNYDNKVTQYREMIQEQYLELEKLDDYNIHHLLEVTIGEIFILKSPNQKDSFVRIRVTKINTTQGKITYWAMDEGRVGECEPKDLRLINEVCHDLEILAVPGVFETGTSPEKLEKFQVPSSGYVMAVLKQPKFLFDYSPRNVNLI